MQVMENDDARLLLLLDLGFQGVAEGLKPGAVGGESGLVLLLLSFNQGFVLELLLEGLRFLSFWSKDRKLFFERIKEASPCEEKREAFVSKEGRTVFPLR